LVKLENVKPNAIIHGLQANESVTIINVDWFGTEVIQVTFKTQEGKLGQQLVYRDQEARLELAENGRPWSFDGDGSLFRLVAEAGRIRLAHLFDRVLAVHTSVVEPLPHQITAVYETMLARQPLRFLLADDPGAGKTIMAGLLIKELIARGDLQRCLIVCPGSLAEQWQDELSRRFDLPFEILTADKVEAARTRNWFFETDLAIVRLDKLSRDADLQEKMRAPECRWDLVVCDEAHKMSATFFGGEVKYTKRYKLGETLSTLTRHFLLMTATPHNGKEEDFQLFLALLDADRFEGKFRDGVHTADVSDLMRRMVKEDLYKFDAQRLFPHRCAHTVPYKLSEPEARLYKAVTDYVREEFNRAEALQNESRAGTVGFALTILQRRLASSPEAIYQSIRRRRERLESVLRELEALQRESPAERWEIDSEDVEDLEDAPENEVVRAEEKVLDRATAARTIQEFKAEIRTLTSIEALAAEIRRSQADAKWRELAKLLHEIFSDRPNERDAISQNDASLGLFSSKSEKLVIFTEHRDTLNYLTGRIANLLGRKESVVVIHGGMSRDDRRKSEESFRHDPLAQVLIATDAAGEGINLQRAHLMVNYDLPWNPNRLEQRFGRIHRIGQTKECHLWNLVADETREGDVYRTLLEKLEQARAALGGKVFDVLGKLQFQGKPLRDLLIEAIRDGEKPEIQAKLNQAVAEAFDRDRLANLLAERALARDAMDVSLVRKIGADMERAEARRLQPHYIASFFHEAFKRLGGALQQREPRRYEVTYVPAELQKRHRRIGAGDRISPRYERIAFEKSLIASQGHPPAAFICPGHPLLDAVIDLTLERDRNILRRGAILIDERDFGVKPRAIFFLEHSIQDASLTRLGERRVISKRVLYVEIDSDGRTRHLQYAPYLDFRPLKPDEPDADSILSRPECAWITPEIERLATDHAVLRVVPDHLNEVRSGKLQLVAKIEAAVKERLTKEISHWDHRAEELKLQEQAGKPNARLNSQEARKRADDLGGRLQRRLDELAREREIVPLPPVVTGGLLVAPLGLLMAMQEKALPTDEQTTDKQAVAARAREIVMAAERELGFEPIDREYEKLGYDIESRAPETGKLRFIEVKGRVAGAETLTVTKNEILFSLNKPEDFFLAIVEFRNDGTHRLRYLRSPFRREPDFAVTSVNYDFSELLAMSLPPEATRERSPQTNQTGS
jgi:SNF2 family DNA or RNA helicase